MTFFVFSVFPAPDSPLKYLKTFVNFGLKIGESFVKIIHIRLYNMDKKKKLVKYS